MTSLANSGQKSRLEAVCLELISIRYLIFQLLFLHLRYLKVPQHLQIFQELR